MQLFLVRNVSIPYMNAQSGVKRFFGNLLLFNIQGIPLEPRLSSIRTRTKSKLSPFFYFVFPNISFIDAAETAKELGVIIHNISKIVGFFASFSILAGVLILISSILSTRYARIRDAVYYKILGGRSSFVYSVYIYEIFLGMLSALFAVCLAQLGSWALCHYLFEISYKPNLPASLVLVGGTILMVGMVSSWRIVRRKPSEFLREQTYE